MKLIYTPEDGDREEFSFQLMQMMSFDAEALEDVGGTAWGSYEEWADKLSRGNFRARRALLWVFLRRQNPRLKLAELVVRFDELTFGAEDDERDEARRRLQDDDTLTDDERGQLEAMLEDDEPVGKDESGDGTTDSESPQPDTAPSASN